MRETLEVSTSSELETILLGAAIGRLLEPGDIILLVGDLGAGKTRLSKGIVSAAAHVSPEDVVSPTFSLINRFDGDFPIYHADLYRLEADRILEIGLEDTLDDEGALIVEWAEKIEERFGDPLTVYIMYGDADDVRRIVMEWSPGGTWENRLRSFAGNGWRAHGASP